ncbi:MAG: hypothetical protein IT258_16240 [Saprospiraceae bacterium]|nr:hypothetical protein [Saprospiraceae bacterium]
MTERLKRFLLFAVLFSLGLNGRLSAINELWSGAWSDSQLAELAMPLEEEVETESETHLYLFNNVDCENGGGGDDDIELHDGSENDLSPPAFVLQHATISSFHLACNAGNLTKEQIKANILNLASASKPLLFLLYHNIKSDTAHLV